MTDKHEYPSKTCDIHEDCAKADLEAESIDHVAIHRRGHWRFINPSPFKDESLAEFLARKAARKP